MPEGLTLGSLFDGIGGWCLAAVRAGIRPIWSSEIEKFPLEVTARHFPDVVQLGDVTKIDGAKIEPADIICAGSPCQDLSVAGKRAGLAGERSGLFVRAVDIVRQMRVRTNGKYPRFFVWENVPALSAAITDGTFRRCSRKSDRPTFQCLNLADGQQQEWSELKQQTSHGECSTLNIGESPSVAKESSLSQILQPPTDVPQKCYLSSRACQGILRRAKEMGKKLPEMLEKALKEQAYVGR